MSDGSGFRDIHVPRKCPKLAAELLPGRAMHVEIKGDPFIPGAYSPGVEYTGAEYDFPGGELSQVIRGWSRGPVTYRGRSCVEIVEVEFSKNGEALARNRRIIYVSSRFAHTLLTHVQRNDGSGYIEVSDIQVPLMVGSKIRWDTAEFERNDDGQYGEPVLAAQRTFGLHTVFIAKSTFTCLRWCRQIISPETGIEEAEESFIDVSTGLPVLIRHYVGRGWPNLESYKKSPRMELNGSIYYLWFVRRLMWSGTSAEP